MNTLKKVRFTLESLLARFGLLVVPILPRGVIRVLASLAGHMAYTFSRKLRKITLANLDIAFGDTLTMVDKQRIGIQTFCTTALVILDLFWFARHTTGRMMKYITLDSSIREYLGPTPVIGVTAHFGNWELFSRAFAANGLGYVAVVAPLANLEVDRLFNKVRNMPGIEFVQKQGAIKALLKSLRHNKRVGLLLDQNTRPEEGGVFVDFFGLPAPLSNAAAVLSERTGAPVVTGFCLARRNGTYHLYALPLLKPRKELSTEKNVSEITQTIANSFESEIRKHPEQWLWMYKRWKYIAPGMNPEAYPFYSRPL